MNELRDMIGLGSRVKVRDLEGEAEFSVVEPGEADAVERRVSAESPLGRRCSGDRSATRYRASGGVQSVTVVEVNS